MRYIIYKTTNTINGKIYIGQTTESSFNNGYMGSGTYIKAAISRYGKESFVTECLELVDERKKVKKQEEYWINEFDATNPEIGYNAIDKSTGAQGNSLTERIQVLITKKELQLLNDLIIKNAMHKGERPKALSPFVRELIQNYIDFHKHKIEQHPGEQRSFTKDEVKRYVDGMKDNTLNKSQHNE